MIGQIFLNPAGSGANLRCIDLFPKIRWKPWHVCGGLSGFDVDRLVRIATGKPPTAVTSNEGRDSTTSVFADKKGFPNNS